MPDICMCDGGNCPLKEDCYRYTAKPDKYGQSCFVDPPYDHKAISCEFFMPNNAAKKKALQNNPFIRESRTCYVKEEE